MTTLSTLSTISTRYVVDLDPAVTTPSPHRPTPSHRLERRP